MTNRKSHFLVLFLLVLFSWSMVLLLGPLVGVIAEDFGIASETTIGNISAIFLLVGGLCAFFWVAVEDRLSKSLKSSRKTLLIFATIIWATGMYLSSVAASYVRLLTFQLIAAFGYAAITPLAFSMAMDLTPPEQRAKTFGLLDIAAMLGGASGFLISGLLVDFVPWGVPFILIATLGLITVAFVIDIEDPKRGQQERELEAVLAGNIDYRFFISKESLAVILKKGSNFLILVLTIILNIASGSITYYFTRMMVNDHLFASSTAVLFFLATYSSQAIGAVFWTRRADQKFQHSPNGKVRVLLESLLLGPPFLILAYSLSFDTNNGFLILSFALLLAIGAFMLSGQVAISFTLIGETNPPEMRSTIFSLNNLAQTLGRSAGIALMGVFFLAWGEIYRYGFMIMSTFYWITIFCVIPLFQRIPRELDQLKALLRERAAQLNPPNST